MQYHGTPHNSAQPETLDQRTNSYSKAAAAAGVSLLALAVPTEAKVVITTHINIPVTETVLLDLNHDGVSDVEFIKCGYHSGNFCSFFLGAYSTYLSARPLHGGGILEKRQTGLASNLVRSAPI